MSRSYTKVPVRKQRNDQYYKRFANKKVRQLPVDFEIPPGSTFKKLSERYDICDWRSVSFSKNNEIREWRLVDGCITVQTVQADYTWFLK